MRTWTTLATALLVFGLAGMAEARHHQGGKHNALHGKITQIVANAAGTTLTIEHKGTTATVALAATTQIQRKTAKHTPGKPPRSPISKWASA